MPRGRYSAKLDDKYRLRLPGAFVDFFRTLPENKFFLSSLDRRIGLLYPISVWRENEKFFETYDGDQDALDNVMFNANDLGSDVEMDGQGRILVNADLRKALGWEGQELNLQAVQGRVEIRTEALVQEQRLKSSVNPVADVKSLKKVGLR
jgi:DNA-binding transcriptional regulator/RsmH inhibitor MraZ